MTHDRDMRTRAEREKAEALERREEDFLGMPANERIDEMVRVMNDQFIAVHLYETLRDKLIEAWANDE